MHTLQQWQEPNKSGSCPVTADRKQQQQRRVQREKEKRGSVGRGRKFPQQVSFLTGMYWGLCCRVMTMWRKGTKNKAAGKTLRVAKIV